MNQMKSLLSLLCLFSTLAAAQESAAPVTAESQPAVTQPSEAEAPPAEAPKPATVPVRMHTELGDIIMAIEIERAPITAGNFLRYVDNKRFDGMGFYRAMKIDEAGNYGLVQTGIRDDARKLFKPIDHEPTTQTGLSHINGALSMARTAPGTATSDFFIIVGNLPALDAQPTQNTGADNLGYAVFGQVVEGMDVVKKIMEQPRSLTEGEGAMKGQMLATPVKILTVRRAQ